VVVLEKRSGRIVAADDRRIGRRLLGGQWSSPAMGIVGGRPRLFFGGGDGVCYAFGPPDAPAGDRPATLPCLWSFDCNPPDYRERNGQRIRYRSRTGPSEIVATPVFHEGRLYVATGQDPRHGKGRAALNCIETRGPDAGRAVWVNREINRCLSTAAIHDGLLYVADLAGRLHCVDIATGRTVWTHALGCPVWSSALVADGKVHIVTPGRRLWILRAGREKRVVNCIRLPGPAYTTPVAANGVLYIATQKWLFAIERTGETLAVASDVQAQVRAPSGGRGDALGRTR
jgi:outer membrane protein assembly factor BamB